MRGDRKVKSPRNFECANSSYIASNRRGRAVEVFENEPPSGDLAGQRYCEGECTMRFVFLVLAFIFLIIWLFSWAAFHIAGGLIHILLVIAVILFIVHFVRGRPAA